MKILSLKTVRVRPHENERNGRLRVPGEAEEHDATATKLGNPGLSDSDAQTLKKPNKIRNWKKIL